MNKKLHRTAPSKLSLLVRLILGSCVVVYTLNNTYPLKAQAAINEAFTYQGKIVNSDGTNLTNSDASCYNTGGADTCDIRVSLYDASSGGTLVWQETKSNVEVSDFDGIFNLTLDCGGTFNTCDQNGGPDFSSGTLYIEVEFDPDGDGDFAEGETFTPRRELTATPYSFNSLNAEQLGNQAASSYLRSDADEQFDVGSTLTIAGDIDITGSLEISGTTVTADAAELNLLNGATATNGGVVFGDGTKLTQDSANFYYDDTSNYLGLGTTAPSSRLEVAGDITLGSADNINFGSVGIKDAGINNTTSGGSLIGLFDEFDNTSATNVQDAFDDIDAAIGTRSYTNDNYVTDGESLTSSINALDTQLGTLSSSSHPALSLAGTLDYLSLVGGTQVLTLNAIDLTTDITGILPAGDGGTGIDTSASTGVATVSAGTWSIASSLSTSLGGTGLTSIGSSNQLLGVNAGGTALEYSNISDFISSGTGISVSGSSTLTITNTGVTSVSGTANQVNVSAATGAVTLSLPQDINSSASVQFGSVNLGGSGATVSSILDEDNFATNSATALATQQSIKVYVDSQIGTSNELSELGDTDISSPASGQILIYDGTNSWDNVTVSGDATINASGNLQLGTGVVGGTELASSGVTANSYGSSSAVPTFTVDEDGRITAAGTTTISSAGITNDTILEIDLDVSNTAVDNYVLTYDNASGGFTWVNPTTVGSGIWVDGGSTSYLNNGDNIGIGTTVASEKLDVVGNAEINGNIIVSGTVDGRDIASDGSNLDNLYTTIGLSDLTAVEVDQLENIGATTISSTQWGYLGSQNQALSTTSSPTFNGLTVTTLTVGSIDLSTNSSTSSGASLIGLFDNSFGNIAANTTVQGAIGELDSSITTNAGNISTNSTNISTNTGNISTNTTNIGNRTYTNDNIVTDSQTITASIDALDTAFGNRTYTNDNVVTDTQTVTASIDALDTAIGNRTYTDDYVVTDGQSLAASIDAIDQALNDVASGTTGVWVDNGSNTYLNSLTDNIALGGTASTDSSFYFDVATGNIIFEGATEDDFETTLQLTDPTADRTIILPNASGTISYGTGTANQVAYWSDTNTLASEAQLATSRGGTGIDTSGATGVATVNAGTWSISSALLTSLGGTGLNSIGTGDQLLGVNSGGTALEYKNISSLISGGTGVSVSGTNTITITNTGVTSLAGTANQVSVSAGTGSVTLSLPQDIDTGADVQFDTIYLGVGVTATAILDEDNFASDSASALATQQSIKAYVDNAISGVNDLADLGDTDISSPSSGQVLIYDGTNSWDNITLGGDATINASGSLTISGDSVALGTDTTGNYVASFTAGAGLTGDASGEGSTPTLAIGAGDGITVNANDVAVNASDLAGTGLSVVSNNFVVDLGTSIDNSEIVDGTILEADLDISNTAVDNYVLTYNAAGTNFTWVDPTTLGGSGVWQQNSGVVSPATITDDVSIGGTGISDSEFYFDVGNELLTLRNTTGGNSFVVYDQAGNDTTPFVIDEAGNVGIGTSNPGYALDVNGTTRISGATTIGGTAQLDSVVGGTDNTVLVLNGSNQVVSDEIDSRVWGTSLIDGSGSTNGVAYFSDGDTITSEAQLSTSRGGTGVDGSSAANGQILIGNGAGYTLSTLTAGTGIGITNASGSITITNSFGTAIETGEINDGTILEADLDVSNTAIDNYVLTYNAAGTNFTWVDPTTLGGASVFNRDATNGILYPTTITDDLAIGGTDATDGTFYVDAGTGDISTDGSLTVGTNIVGATGNIDFTNFDVTGSSGDITTAGDIAVNGGNITSTAGTLVINAAGAVDIQDNLTVDSLTTDTGGITIASGQDLTIGTIGLNDNASVSSGASLIGLFDNTFGNIAANTTVQGAIGELDSAITTNAGNISTNTSNISTNTTNIGNRTYTDDNYVVDSQTLTASIDALDQAIAANKSLFTDTTVDLGSGIVYLTELTDDLAIGGTAVGDAEFFFDVSAQLLTLRNTTGGNSFVVYDQAGNDTTPFVIDETGSVGIGTSNPGFTLDVNGTARISGATTISGTTQLDSVAAGADNTVLVLNGSNQIVSDEIDARVWGTSLLDGSGSLNGVAYFTDGDTLTSEAQLATSRGGTGVDGSSAANGQLLIGNGTGYSLGNLTAGVGIGITNAAGSITINNSLGTSIETGEITDGTILEADLDISNTAVDNYVLTYNAGGTNFTWVDPSTLSTNYWSQISGVLSPATITDDLAIGGTAASEAEFFFDVSNELLTLRNTTGGNSFVVYDQAGNDTTPFVIDEAGSVGIGTSNPGFALDVNGTVRIASTVQLDSVSGGTDNTVLILNGSNQIVSDEIDARVWGTSLIDGSGSINGVAYFTDGDTLTSEAQLSASRGGTGLDTSGSTGVATVSAGTWSIASSLSTSLGGTGIDGSSAPNGQILIGNGAGYTLANLTAGTGIGITNASGSITITNSFGTAIETGEITNGTILEADLDISNTAVDNYVLTYNAAGTNFTWVDPTTLGGASVFNRDATNGILYPTTITDDLAIGGTDATDGTFYVDAGTGDISTDGSLTVGINIVGATGNIDFTNFDVTGSSGDVTTAGDVAVNGGNITSTAGTLVINAAGAVDIQDNLSVDSLTTDTGGITIASGQDLTIGTIGLNDNASVSSGASLIGLFDNSFGNIAANTTVQGAIGELDSAITTNAGNISTNTTNISTNTTNIGNRTYTDDNYVVDSQTLTASIDALDQAIAANKSLFTDTTVDLGSGIVYLTELTDDLAIGGTAASDAEFFFDVGNELLTLRNTTGGNSFVVYDQAGNDTTPFVIDEAGSVGIGTSNPGFTLDVNGTVRISGATTIGGTVQLDSVVGGTDNTVLILNGSNQIVSDEIDARVWGTSLIDGSGVLNGVAYFTDGDTITSEAQLAASRGGTGVDGSSATNGQLLIGNGTGYSLGTLTTGVGIGITNAAGSITISNSLGTSIETGEITDGTILEADLDISNTAVDNYVLTYNSGGSNFTWVDPTTLGGASVFNRDATNGILYPTTITDDLAIGGTDATDGTFYVDAGTGNITTDGSIAVNGGNITSTSATLVINAAGAVDIQDNLTVDSLTTDTGGITIASGQDLTIGTVGLNDNASVSSGASLIGLFDNSFGNIAANTTVQGAIGELDSAITTNAGNISTNTSNISTNTTNIGNRIYTDDNYVVDSQTLTASIDALDQAIAANKSLFTDTTVDLGSGIVYLTELTDNLAIGGTAASDAEFFFDVGNELLTLRNTTGGNSFVVYDQAGNDTTPFVIDETGSVGIGTSNPGFTLDVNGTVRIASTVQLDSVVGGTDNTVLVLNGSNQIVSDEIDARVWGTSLLDGSGSLNGVAYFTDSDTLASEAQLSTSRGGTGIDGSSTANGQLLIGNGTGYTLANLTPGVGIGITNAAGSITINNTLGTSIETGEITNGTILEADLDISNTAVDNYVLTYNAAGTNFTWVDPSTLSTNYWNQISGVLSPATIADDLAIGGTATSDAEFFFDVSNELLTLRNTTGGNSFVVYDQAGNDTTPFVIDEAGNVGIGTSNPGFALDVNGTVRLASTVQLDSVVGGTDNTVLVLNGSNQIVSDEIDSRVWGTSLLDGSGSLNGVAYFTDGDTLASEAQLSTSRGGTGLDGSSAANGQLLIGNGTGYSLANLSAGVGIGITNAAGSITINNVLGTSIETGEITNGTILEADLDISNTAIDNYVLTYNSGGSNFTWVDPTTLGTNYWSRNSTAGIVYPGTTSDDLAIGGTGPATSTFFVDAGTGNITSSGDLYLGGNTIFFDDDTDATFGYDATNNYFTFDPDGSGGNPDVIIEDSGNVGIGITATLADLHVVGTNRTGANLGGERVVWIEDRDTTTTSGVEKLVMNQYQVAPSSASSASYVSTYSYMQRSGSSDITGVLVGSHAHVADYGQNTTTRWARGVGGAVATDVSANNATITYAAGGHFQVAMADNTSTYDNAYGVYVFRGASNGTVNNRAGLALEVPDDATNMASLLIRYGNAGPAYDPITNPSGTFAIYNEDTSDNYFAGDLGLGITAPAGELHIYSNDTGDIATSNGAQIILEQDSTGDSGIQFELTGGQIFSLGIDNSSSNDNFVLFDGSTARLTIDGSTGDITVGQDLLVNGTQIGLDYDADSDNVLGTSTAPGTAGSDLYWGNDLLCDVSEANCGWATATSSPFTSASGVIYPSTITDDLALGGTAASDAEFFFDVGNELLTLRNTTGGNSFVVFDQSGNDTTPFVIDEAGSVGIGTSNPGFTLDINGTVRVASTVQLDSVAADTDNTVLVLNGSNQIVSDEIDSRVWGTSLIDGSGVLNGVAYFTDGDTITSEAQLSTSRGGTGLDGSSAANGQLLIGNGTGYSLANLSAGVGIGITNAAGSITINNALGTAIETGEITDGTILEADLDISNTAVDNYVLTYNAGGTNFTWVDPSTLGGASVFSRDSGNGILYPTTITDDLALGGTAVSDAEFYFDVGNELLTLRNTTGGNSFVVYDQAGNDTTPFLIDESGNVGIGTSNPGFTLDVNGTVRVASTVQLDSVGGGTDDTVLILNGSGQVVSDEIDSRVWGTSLIDGSGVLNGVAYFTDGDTITSEAQLSTSRGGTGVDGSSASDGQILIGNGTGYSLANLSAGVGIGITNAAGSITINNTLGTSIENGEITDGTILEADLDVSNTAVDNYVLTYNAGGTNFTWVDPTTLSTNYWQQVSGVLAPATIADDLAIGGTAASDAEFFFDVGNELLTLRNTTGGNSFVVYDQAGNDTTPFVIDESGSVGIGTTNPGFALDVNGTVRIASTAQLDSVVGGTDNTVLILNGSNQIVSDEIDSRVWGTSLIDGSGSLNGVAYFTDGDTIASEAQLSTSRGGTGLDGSSATNGQLLIGNGTGYSLANLSAGVGIGITNAAGSITINNSLGTAIETGEIVNGTILEADLDISNTAVDNYVLTYNAAGTNFTWVDPTTLDTNYWSRDAGNGIVYPGILADDLAIGGTAAADAELYFDVGNELLTLRNTTGGNSFVVYDQAGNDTTPFVIDESGSVGIGTTNPGFALDVNGTARISGATTIGGTVQLDSVAGGTDNTVLVLNGSSQIVSDEIDARVWGTSLIDGSGALNGVAYFTDGDTLTSEAQLSTSRGGTGVDGSSASDGQILIGNGTGYSLANLSAGVGIGITNAAGSITITNSFGTAIETSEIANGTILEADLDISNTAVDNYVLTYNQAGLNFTWVDPSTLGGSSVFTRDTGNGIVYPSTTSDDLAIGGTDAVNGTFFVDAGTGNVSTDGSLTVGTNIVGTTGNIDFSNFDVVGGTGNVTTAGDLAVNGGDITSTSALNVDSSGNISIRSDADTNDFIYFDTTSNEAAIYFENAAQAFTNDVGFRVNGSTGELEYRDEDESAWTTLDSLAGGAVTLDSAYTGGQTIGVDTADILLNLSDNTNDYGLVLDNPTTGDIATAIEITTTGVGGTIGTAIDLSDAEIATAINIGTNDIVTGAATISSTELDILDGGITLNELTDTGTLTAGTVDINGGNIDGTVLGANTAAAASVTTLSISDDMTWTATTPTITINSTEAMTVTDGTDSFSIDSSASAFTYTDGTNSFTFDVDSGPSYAGTARPAKSITLSPEYSGGVLTAFYGAGTDTNITGTMISDSETSAANSLRTYYQWERSGGTQHYQTIAVRVTLPADFSAWATTNAVQVEYVTENATNTNSDLDVRIYLESNSTTAVASSTDNASTSWTTVTIDDSTLDDAAAPEWDAAGETAIIYLRMGSQSANYVRVGDITLNYLAAF